MLVAVFWSCEKKNDSIIDPSYQSPVISSPYRSTDSVFTTSASPLISFSTSILVSPNGGSGIKTVICKVYDINGLLLNTFNMSDNGIPPDSTSGDGRYSVNVLINNISCLIVGNYNIQYIATNNDGIASNLISSTFYVKNTANQVPVLSNPNLPDSVVRPVTGQFDLTITIDATDPDGPCDIYQVYFDAYRSTGFYIGRVPMTHGNNNTFTFTNPVLPADPDSSYGYFKYYFRALDNSGALSAIFKDSIKFVRP